MMIDLLFFVSKLSIRLCHPRLALHTGVSPGTLLTVSVVGFEVNQFTTFRSGFGWSAGRCGAAPAVGSGWRWCTRRDGSRAVLFEGSVQAGCAVGAIIGVCPLRGRPGWVGCAIR